MAEARDNRYEDASGGGGFGKFRKRPFRRNHATPYDRPPTAVRNLPAAAAGANNGWLSRLVDPARRLIASGAYRLLSSVKRLPPPPPPQPLPEEAETERGDETNQKEETKHMEAIATESLSVREVSRNEHDNPVNLDEDGGFTELEVLLKQKTFTKPEVDRLTALLQSRIVDQPVGDRDKKFEMFPSKVGPSQDRKDMSSATPTKDGVRESRLISAPNRGWRNVPEEDVASPAELAKAYMGSMPSKVSPSLLGYQSQPLREDSRALMNLPFSSKSPITTIMQRTTGPAAIPENGILAPRSRGRFAISTMARTPYSRRFQSTANLQGPRTAVGSHGGPPSSSRDAWRNSRSPASAQATLKRRSSVLDNDIGAIGPIRRIRQRSNLLPASGIVSSHGVGFGVDSTKQQMPKGKAVLPVEPSVEKGENGDHGSGFSSVPSKSSEMASRIFQQLGVLVSSREKSPTKLSPSMLNGPALRSLENLDSSKFFETIQESNKLDFQREILLPVTKMQDKIEENGPTKSIVYEKSTLAVDTIDAKSWPMSAASDAKKVAISNLSSDFLNSPPKRRAFQMTAHEDSFEFDDGEYSNGPFSFKSPDAREKLDTVLVEKKSTVPESEKPSAISEVKTAATSILNQQNVGTSVVGKKSSDLMLPAASLLSETVKHSMKDKHSTVISDEATLRRESTVVSSVSLNVNYQAASVPSETIKQAMKDKHSTVTSDEATLGKESTVVSSVSFGDKVVSVKESNGSPPLFEFTFKPVDKVSPFTSASNSLSSNAVVGSSSGFDVVSAPATRLVTEELELEKPDQGSSLKDGVPSLVSGTAFSAASTVPVSSGIFSFSGSSSNSSSLSNGSLFLPLSSSSDGRGSIPAVFSTTVSTTSSSSLPISASAPSFSAASTFKFGSPSLPFAFPSAAATTLASTEANAKGLNPSNFTSIPFGTSSALESSGSNIFGGASTMNNTGGTYGAIPTIPSTESSTGSSVFGTGLSTLTTTSQSQGVTPFSAISAQSSTPASVATSTESLPVQQQSSSSGSSFLASSPSNAKMFSSGPSFMLSSTVPSSEVSSVSLSTSTTSSLFGTSWQTPKFPVFGATSSSVSSSTSVTSTVFGSSWQTPKSSVSGATSSISTSTGFGFGASAASNMATTSSTPVAFGSTTSASASSLFSFSSSASSPLQPVFGNTNAGFATIVPSPSGNGDQMNMEDGMAEDTVQAAPPASIFGQQAAPPASLFGQQPMPTPSSGFVFGSPNPSGLNHFGAPAPAGASPFQFGGPPSAATPANPSPFQASSSLEFNAGSSFSLGSSAGDKSSRRIVKVKRGQRKKGRDM